jgi:peptidoglycan hydrolase CwlO-like protein
MIEHILIYTNRIRGLVKSKALHEQVTSMQHIVSQLKANKDQVQKEIEQLKQRVNQLINDITVG